MDLTVTAQAITGAISASSNGLPSTALAIGALAGPLIQAKLKSSGIMDKISGWFKPFVPTLISFGGGALTAMMHGASWHDALLGSLAAAASSQLTHNFASTPNV
jgi:hypothetical protein